MTDKDYKKNISRLKEIEETVKNPETGLDNIEILIDETDRLVKECYSYTRSLRAKLEDSTQDTEQTD